MSYPDVTVVGLGAMGSASLYQLARRGARVLGIDRFNPPHIYGSSHGETRITRLITGEGDLFVPVVKRSHQLWRELENESGESLFRQTGVLYVGSGGSELIPHVNAVAQRADLARLLLTGAQIRTRFPHFQVTDESTGLFDPAGGALFPERCVDAQLRLAQRLGAQIHTNEKVLEVQASKEGVRVITDRGDYQAGQAVLTAGPWLSQFVGDALSQVLRVYRQVLYWFATDGSLSYDPDHFPVFIWSHGPQNGFYGFPSFAPDGSVKVATSQFVTESSPDSVERTVTPAEIEAIFEQHIRGRLLGVKEQALQTTTCLYTMTPDGSFILDRHP